MKKERLDNMLVKRGITSSREVAKRLIMAGMVLVNDQKVFKPSYQVKADDKIELLEKPKYVSRGGYKLEGAINDFKISVEGKVCMDVGASTGGFTDCLLQNKAKLVYAIDVGYGQIAQELRSNPRVIVYERINARYLDTLYEEGKIKFELLPELVVMDLSFISVTKVIIPVAKVTKEKTEFLVLIKPQFELEPKYVGKGGIVKEEYHNIAIQKVKTFLEDNNFEILGLSPSKLKGTDGNQEYFIYFIKRNN